MKKFATLLLAAALIGNSMDLSVLTVNAAEKEKTLICEKEEHTHDEKCYAEAAQKKSITAWTWNDEAEMLDLEENVLVLPGASKEQVVLHNDIVAFLPASITATVTTSASVTETEGTEEVEETVTLEGWECENYPEEGAYTGNYIFTANLPEGYELTEDAAALEVTVELGDAAFYEGEDTTNPFTVTGGTEGTDYTFTQSDTIGDTLTIKSSTPLTISGGSESEPITGQIAVAAGVKANLTLNGLHLTGQASEDISVASSSPIDLTATSTLTLTLAESSTNTLTGGAASDAGIGGPGIHVPEGATLTVQGSGKLDVTGGKLPGSTGNGGVGIGGVAASTSDGNGEACGTVVITGGEVTVTGGTSAYGIGGGWSSTSQGLMGTVIITGGTVTVASANAVDPSIGGRQQTDSGVAVILVEIANFNGAGVTSSACSASIVPRNERYEVIGALSLPDLVSEYTLPANNTLFFVPLKTGSSTLTIPENVALNIPEGVTLELDSYYKDTLVDHITNNGTVRIACNHSSYTEYAAAFGGKVEKLHTWENGKCKYCNEPHTHTASDWTYTKGAEQNIIKATCKVCHKEATITLKAPENLTYDGTAKTVTVEQSPEGVLPNLPAVVYDDDHTNAGTHTASLTCGGVTATLKFTIGKASQTLSFAETALTKTYGDSAFTPKLNHDGDGKVTYASSNSEVASVDTDGKVTIRKAGSATITASAAESNNFNASNSASYTLTVNRKPVTVFLADRNVTVGSTVPAVALTYQSLANGDTVEFTPAFTLTDKDGKPLKGENDAELTFAEALTKAVGTVGSYTIKWINAEELKALSDSEGNYTFTVAEGGDTATLTVNSQPSSGGGGYSGGGGGTALPDTKPETKPDTNKEETITKTETDINSKGKEVVTTTTTKTDADGNVISVTEKTVIPESSASTSTTVTVRKDGKGEVTSAKAVITKTVTTGSKATIQSFILAQIIEAAGTSDVTVTMTVKDADGKTKYSVKADAKDFESGNKLYIYKYDTKTKVYTMVDGKTYTVSKAGNVSVSQKVKATYYLLDTEEAAEINEKILSTIKPKKASVTLKAGESVTFTLSSKANPDNIKSITYTTSKKSVATVNKKGKVYAKKKGTATVKAKVTLKNGMTKTIKMKIKVK